MGGCVVTLAHFIYADNVWLLAESASDLGLLVEEAMVALASENLVWKHDGKMTVAFNKYATEHPIEVIANAGVQIAKQITDVEIHGSLQNISGEVDTLVLQISTHAARNSAVKTFH